MSPDPLFAGWGLGTRLTYVDIEGGEERERVSFMSVEVLEFQTFMTGDCLHLPSMFFSSWKWRKACI